MKRLQWLSADRPKKIDFQKGLSCLQMGLTLVLLILACQGKGSHAVYVALWLALPALRLLFSSAHRLRQKLLWETRLGELRRFADVNGAVPWRSLFWFGMLPTLLFALVNGGTQSSGDNLGTVLTASSLVLEGNFDLREFVGQRGSQENCPPAVLPYFMRCTKGGVMNAYPAGMLVFAVPVTLVSYLVGGRIQNPAALRLEKWTAVWVAGLVSFLFLFIALHLIPAEAAIVSTLMFSLASVNLSTVAQGLWTQGGVLTGLLLLLALEFHYEDRMPLWGIALQGFAISLMLSSRLTSAVLVLIFGLWVLMRNPIRAVKVTSASLIACLPWAIFYYLHYGNIAGPQMSMGSSDLWTLNFQPALLGVLFSPARGLLVYQPWLWLGLLYAFPSVRLKLRQIGRTAGPRFWKTALTSMIVAHVTLMSTWTIWDGGTCYGSRLLAEVVPLGGLLLLKPVAMLWKGKQGRTWILALGLLGFLIHANGVYGRGGFWQLRAHSADHYWDWIDAPYTFPFLKRW